MNLQSIRLLMESADAFHGRQFTRDQVRDIADLLIRQQTVLNNYEFMLNETRNMLASYMNEYGDELFNELKDEGIVEGEVVEDEENVSEVDGPSNETGRMDPSVEEEE